ncbi:MAG: DUF433 domain-containing protein [Chitinophagales bacterium]
MKLNISSHIVADPEICHGALIFKGTRILVSGVLEQIASGMSWEVIIESWRGKINREAILEVVSLVRR